MNINYNNSFYQNLEIVPNEPQKSGFHLFRKRSSAQAKETLSALFEQTTANFATFSSEYTKLSLEKQNKYRALFAKKFFLEGKFEDSTQCFALIHPNAATPQEKLIHAISLFRSGKLIDAFEQLSLIEKVDAKSGLNKALTAPLFNSKLEEEINAVKAALTNSPNEEERDFGSLVASFDPEYCKQFSQRYCNYESGKNLEPSFMTTDREKHSRKQFSQKYHKSDINLEDSFVTKDHEKLIHSIIKNKDKIKDDDLFTPLLLICFFSNSALYLQPVGARYDWQSKRYNVLWESAFDIYERSPHKTNLMQYHLGINLLYSTHEKRRMGCDLIESASKGGLLKASQTILSRESFFSDPQKNVALRHLWMTGISGENTDRTCYALRELLSYYKKNRKEQDPESRKANLLTLLLENIPEEPLTIRETFLLRQTCLNLDLNPADLQIALKTGWLRFRLPTSPLPVPTAPCMDRLTDEERRSYFGDESSAETSSSVSLDLSSDKMIPSTPLSTVKKTRKKDFDDSLLKRKLKIMEAVETTPTGF